MSDDFTPEPIDYDYNDETGESYPVYGDADQAEMYRRYSNKRARRFAEAMHRHLDGIQWIESEARTRVEMTRREVVEAEGDDWWQMVPAEQRQDLSDMASATIQQVELEAQKIHAALRVSAEVLRSVTDAERTMIEDHTTGTLQHIIQARVYGHRHDPIVRTKTGELSVAVPASWWQMFKRDVLKRTRVRMTNHHREHTLTVSAVPFTAFPELPYKAPDTWGPRVRMMLPQITTMSARDWMNHADR